MLRKTTLMVLGAMALGLAGPAQANSSSYDQVQASIEQAREAMMGDPEDALAASSLAVDRAERLPASKRAAEAQATAQWLYAESLIYLNRIEEARPVVDNAIDKVEASAPDSKLHGDLLRSRGAIEMAHSKVLDALRHYQGAYRAFRKAGIPRSQAIALQDIGMIYFEADDFSRALDYFDQASQAYSDDPILTLTGYNNRAEVLRKQGKHEAATAQYRLALTEARALESPMLVTRILTNLAASQADEGDLRGASASIAEARKLAANGEAAGWRPFVLGIAAKIAFQKGNIAEARDLVSRTFEGQDLATTDLLYREYHQIAGAIYERDNNPALSLAHYRAFQRLDSEARAATASTASQLLGARFDFANLKRGQLERDIELERQKGTIRNGLLTAAGVILTLLLIGFVWISRSRSKVKVANLALTEVNVRLEKALRAKTEFLATTSHEIRTPLNGILGMTQVLLTDRKVIGDVRERVEIVHGAGETMKALVDDILDAAKIESGELKIVNEPVELRAVLRDAERLWGDQARTKGLELKTSIGDLPQTILSDGGRLRQIVFNLMSNAIKFTAEGHVSLTADLAQDRENCMRITVSDTGIGIPDEALEEIFEPFKQVQGSMSRQFSGTGLGLAIVRQLAEALGGSVSASSTAGEGSSFILLLPLVEAQPAASIETETAGASALSGANLIVATPDAQSIGMMGVFLAPHVRSLGIARTFEELEDSIADATHLLLDTAIADYDPARLGPLVAAAQRTGTKISLLHDPAGGASVADLMMVGADQLLVEPIEIPAIQPAMQSLYGATPETFVAPALAESRAA